MQDTIIDFAAMMNVVEKISRQELAGGERVNILGVAGDTTSAQVADVVFSIKTKVKKTYVLATKGTTLVLDKTKDNILSIDVQSGFKVDFAIGTVDDPSFGGDLTTSTGDRVTLFFENNLWRIPMDFLPTMTASTSQAHISDEHNIQVSPITIPEISSKITTSTGLVMARLQSTDIQDYIEKSYGSLLHFVQENSHASHFQITSESHGLIPRSGASSNALNRVSSLTILGCRTPPPLEFFFFLQIYSENAKFQCKKKGLFTHIVT